MSAIEITSLRTALEHAEARATTAEASLQAARAWVAGRTVHTPDRDGAWRVWLFDDGVGLDKVDVTPLAALLAVGPAEAAAAAQRDLAGFVDRVLGVPWEPEASSPEISEMVDEVAAAAVSPPARTRDADLPQVWSAG